MKGAHPVRADTYYTDRNLQLTFEKIEVGFEIFRELGSIGDLGEVGVPAGEGDVFGSNGGEFARVGELRGAFAGGGTVVSAGLNFGESVENVGFHEVELGDAVEHDGVAEGGQVYPAGAAGAAGSGAKLTTGLADLLANFVVKLGGERAAADAGAVSFGDAVDLIYVTRCDAEASASASGDGAGRGDVGIGAKINV